MTVKRCSAALAIAAIGGMMLGTAAADSWLPENFSASVSVTNDYVFRGISQTFEEPAGQFTGEWTPAGGPIYIGTFISNVDFADPVVAGDRVASVEVDALFGVRGEYNILKWDIGAIFYIYPGNKQSNPLFNVNAHYAEIAMKTSWDVLKLFTIVGNAYVSPSFQGDAGTGFYLEGGVDVPLPFEITANARLARQFIRTNANFGVRDYNTWSLGVSREFFGRFILGAAYYDTDLGRGACFGGLTICEARGVGYVTFKF